MKIESLQMLPMEPNRSSPATQNSPIPREHPVEAPEVSEQKKKPLQNEHETAEEILNSVEEINIQLESINRSIRFSVDESSGDIVVKIVNTDSGEVIKQIPPDEALRLKEHIQDMLGLIVEEMV
ncbi:MAG: flagellar protein FlaG [Desulfomonilia bacterium]